MNALHDNVSLSYVMPIRDEIFPHTVKRKNIFCEIYSCKINKLTISSGERIPNWTLFTVRRGALESDVAILQRANAASNAAFCVTACGTLTVFSR